MWANKWLYCLHQPVPHFHLLAATSILTEPWFNLTPPPCHSLTVPSNSCLKHSLAGNAYGESDTLIHLSHDGAHGSFCSGKCQIITLIARIEARGQCRLSYRSARRNRNGFAKGHLACALENEWGLATLRRWFHKRDSEQKSSLSGLGCLVYKMKTLEKYVSATLCWGDGFGNWAISMLFASWTTLKCSG